MSYSVNQLPLIATQPPLRGITETYSPLDFFKLYVEFIDSNFSNLQTVTFYVSEFIYETLKDYSFFEKIEYLENSHSLFFSKKSLKSNFSIYVRVSHEDYLAEQTNDTASYSRVLLAYTNNTFSNYGLVFFQKFVSQNFFEVFWMFFLQNNLAWGDFLKLIKKL